MNPLELLLHFLVNDKFPFTVTNIKTHHDSSNIYVIKSIQKHSILPKWILILTSILCYGCHTVCLCVIFDVMLLKFHLCIIYQGPETL